MTKFPYALQAEINRLMKQGMSEAEATELAKYDYAVEHGEKTEFDLTPEQEQASKKARMTGTRKTPITFTKRERKPNDNKRNIINTLFDFMSRNALFINANISNIERQIDFTLDNKEYSLTLTEHRPKKE